MSKEQRPAETGTNDPRVSATYAEIATERVPASLNETILREASRNSGKGYGFWMTWLRPMAWAATVGLCLAIVVELSNVPQPERGSFESLPAAVVDELAEEKDNATRSSRELADQKREAASEPLATPARRNESRNDSRNTPAESRAQSVTPASPPPASDAAAKARVESELFQPDDAPMLQEAEEMVRMRQGSDPLATERAAGSTFAGRAATMDLAVKPQCDNESRATPDDWLECILELEKAGLDTAEEREALLAAFPDTVLP